MAAQQEPTPHLSVVPTMRHGRVDPTRYNRKSAQLVLYARYLLNTLLIAFGDALALSAAVFLGGGVRAYLKGMSMVPEWWWFLIAIWLIAAMGVRLLPGWGLGQVEELRRTVLVICGVFAATATAVFLAKESVETSRLTLSLSFILSLFLIPLFRINAKRVLIHFKVWGMQAVIYGAPDVAGPLIESLKQEAGLGYHPVALFDPSDVLKQEEVEGIPVFSPPQKGEVCADVAIVARPELSRTALLHELEVPLSQYRHVVIIPDLHEAPSLWVKPRDMGGILGLEITFNLESFWSRFLKRSTDVFLVLISLPLWLPLLFFMGLAICLEDRESPLFLQERHGRHGLFFKMYKFRTMHTDAETLLEEKLNEDQELRLEWQENFKLKDDPRITSIGRFLRKTSMDELPQLLNVLKGEMSLVGPRPLPEYHHNALPDRVRELREKLRPGMTGMWQVSGRSDAGHEGLARWDTYYARNWSVWLDVVVLVRTFRVVFQGRGAY